MPQAKIDELLESTGAINTGHFQLSDGRHSDTRLHPVKVMQFPPFCRKVAYEVIRHYWDMDVQVVVAASAQSILFAAEIARQLDARIVYTVQDKHDDTLGLLPDFELHPGDRIVLADDILTDDYPNLRRLGRLILKHDARLIGTASLIDLSTQNNILGVRQISVARRSRNIWTADDCLLCSQGQPLSSGSPEHKTHI